MLAMLTDEGPLGGGGPKKLEYMACRRLFLFIPLSPCTIYVFISETRQIRKQNRFFIYPFLSVFKFKPWANVPCVVGRWEERRGGD